MTKKYAAAFLLFYSAALLFSDGWYISNAAGMALEPAFSGLALRADYALEVRAAGIWSLPPRLAEALRGGLIPAGSAVEEHFLYRKGELISTRWIVTSGVVRAAASFREDGSGYMDIFDEEGVLTEERNYSPDDITLIVRYTYVSGRLRMAESSRIRPDREEVREDADQEDEVPEDESREDAAQEIAAQEDEAREDEARESAPPDAISAGAEAAPDPEAVSGDAGPYIEEVLWTDVYRYSRSSALRSIERRYPEGMDGEEQRNETAFFPGSQARRAASRLVSPYSAFSSEFLMDISAI
ncbi:MAG: hypothetical protein LBK40_01905, partial [Spirochaetaceae bacterium]|nr:hypothetical protein [Spirochaetaceae bacterium]